jgi:hypothetical protein
MVFTNYREGPIGILILVVQPLLLAILQFSNL